MGKYKLSNVAKEDLIRIHQYGVKTFGVKQADNYFNSFFDHFDMIAERPLSFEAVVFVELIVYTSKMMVILLRLWQSLEDKI